VFQARLNCPPKPIPRCLAWRAPAAAAAPGRLPPPAVVGCNGRPPAHPHHRLEAGVRTSIQNHRAGLTRDSVQVQGAAGRQLPSCLAPGPREPDWPAPDPTTEPADPRAPRPSSTPSYRSVPRALPARPHARGIGQARASASRTKPRSPRNTGAVRSVLSIYARSQRCSWGTQSDDGCHTLPLARSRGHSCPRLPCNAVLSPALTPRPAATVLVRHHNRR